VDTLVVRHEAFGVELERVRLACRVTADGENVEEDRGHDGDGVTVDMDGLDGLPWREHSGGLEAQRLLEDGMEVGEAWEVMLGDEA
jgi:hypothetical protein